MPGGKTQRFSLLPIPAWGQGCRKLSLAFCNLFLPRWPQTGGRGAICGSCPAPASQLMQNICAPAIAPRAPRTSNGSDYQPYPTVGPGRREDSCDSAKAGPARRVSSSATSMSDSSEARRQDPKLDHRMTLGLSPVFCFLFTILE